MKERVLSKVKLADNREVRVIKITTGAGDLIRVGVHLMPGGWPLSGAVFPEGAVDEVIAALAVVKSNGS